MICLTEQGTDWRTHVQLLVLMLSSCVSLSNSHHPPMRCDSASGGWWYQKVSSKGQSQQGTTSGCLRKAWSKVSGHCFQLGMLGALLVHTSCASVTFWSILARSRFAPKITKSSFIKYNSKILLGLKSVIFQVCYTSCSVCISHMI